MRVREAEFDEWETYRHLRMAALAGSPGSFRTLLEDVADRPDSEWAAQHEASVRADDRVSFFAETDRPVGVSFSRLEGEQLHIYPMWIEPEARGLGLGRAMIDAAFAWGKVRGATSARLAVTIGNDEGERLYVRTGFEPTGETEPLRDGSDLSCAWLERSI